MNATVHEFFLIKTSEVDLSIAETEDDSNLFRNRLHREYCVGEGNASVLTVFDGCLFQLRLEMDFAAEV